MLAAIWGLSFSFIKIASPEFGSFALAFMRIILAAIFLFAVIVISGQTNTLIALLFKSELRWHLFISGLLGQLLPFILFAKAELTISASSASILNATTPIWSVIVAYVWLKTHVSLLKLLGIILSFIGVSILVGYTSVSDNNSNASILGSGAILLATFCYAYGSNYLKKYLNQTPPLQVATASTIYAAFTGLPLAIYTWPTTEISVQAWHATLLLGFLCTGLAFILFFELIAKVDATSAVSVTFLIPIFGVLWGINYLDEQITITTIIAMLVILAGVVMSNFPQRKLSSN